MQKQTFKMHSFPGQEVWNFNYYIFSIILYTRGHPFFIPYCSDSKKVVRGKTRGERLKQKTVGLYHWKFASTLKKGCLRSGDAMDDQMHMLRIHRVVKLTPSHSLYQYSEWVISNWLDFKIWIAFWTRKMYFEE